MASGLAATSTLTVPHRVLAGYPGNYRSGVPSELAAAISDRYQAGDGVKHVAMNRNGGR